MIGIAVICVGCREQPTDLMFSCKETIEETVSFSSALAYGIDVAPPVVENVPPLEEADLIGVPLRDAQTLGLLFRDATGRFYHGTCKDELCDGGDFMAVFSQCRDRSGCAISGAVKDGVFYPLYTSQSDGRHLCEELQ